MKLSELGRVRDDAQGVYGLVLNSTSSSTFDLLSNAACTEFDGSAEDTMLGVCLEVCMK